MNEDDACELYSPFRQVSNLKSSIFVTSVCECGDLDWDMDVDWNNLLKQQ